MAVRIIGAILAEVIGGIMAVCAARRNRGWRSRRARAMTVPHAHRGLLGARVDSVLNNTAVDYSARGRLPGTADESDAEPLLEAQVLFRAV